MGGLAKVRPYHGDGLDRPPTGWMVMCPACGNGHLFNTTPGPNGMGGQRPCWSFDGDLEAPTFEPSMLVHSVDAKGDPTVCHSYVRRGQMIYLADSTHAKADKVVDLVPW